jgi:uncharacterized protein YkwD
MLATATLLLLINTVRAQPLTMSPKLTAIAQKRCETMVIWSHKGSPTQRLVDSGHIIAGENLALTYESADEIFTALQASLSHKRNNEHKAYRDIGIAQCNNILGTTTVILFTGIKLPVKNELSGISGKLKKL